MPHRPRGTLKRATAIKNEAFPHLKNRTIEDSTAIEIHGGRQVFRMNVIGRQSWHTTSARTPSNDSLQHKRLFQMHQVRPGERPVDLATIRTGQGIALRGNEWRNERDTKVRKRIIRHTDATIITATWRADSTRTSCPHSRRSMIVRRADAASPLPRVYRSLMTNRILSWADEPTPWGAMPQF